MKDLVNTLQALENECAAALESLEPWIGSKLGTYTKIQAQVDLEEAQIVCRTLIRKTSPIIELISRIAPEIAEKCTEFNELATAVDDWESFGGSKLAKELEFYHAALGDLSVHLSFARLYLQHQKTKQASQSAQLPTTIHGDIILGSKNTVKISKSKAGAVVVGDRGEGAGTIGSKAQTRGKKR